MFMDRIGQCIFFWVTEESIKTTNHEQGEDWREGPSKRIRALSWEKDPFFKLFKNWRGH